MPKPRISRYVAGLASLQARFMEEKGPTFQAIWKKIWIAFRQGSSLAVWRNRQVAAISATVVLLLVACIGTGGTFSESYPSGGGHGHEGLQLGGGHNRIWTPPLVWAPDLKQPTLLTSVSMRPKAAVSEERTAEPVSELPPLTTAAAPTPMAAQSPQSVMVLGAAATPQPVDAGENDAASGEAPAVSAAAPVDTAPPDVAPAPPAAEPIAAPSYTAIGDSVLLGAAPQLQKLLPGIVIDSKVGRQMAQAQAVVDSLREQGKLSSRVIIELGTNGPFPKKTYMALLQSIGAEQVIIINTRVPKPWEEEVNTTLQEIVDSVPNAVLVDWQTASGSKEGLLSGDGVHLTPLGAAFYADMVAKAVKSAME